MGKWADQSIQSHVDQICLGHLTVFLMGREDRQRRQGPLFDARRMMFRLKVGSGGVLLATDGPRIS